jgi:molybdate transport system substrate-binding protein
MGVFASSPSPDVICPSPVKGEGVLIILLLLAITWIGPPVRAEETVLVAAAANLSHTLEELIARYEDHTGNMVRASYGASGNLTQQILQGAPFQVFLPADRKSLDRLQMKNHSIVASNVLARGRIGFFVPRDSSLAGQDLKSLLHALQNGKYRRLALANPETAPYGVAAMEALQKAGVWVLEEDKLLQGESVAQAMQFALSGGVDLGVVPLSYARLTEVAGKGEFLEIPEEWHQPLLQYRVLLVDTAPARSFYEFLRSPTAKEILKSHGYKTQLTNDK